MFGSSPTRVFGYTWTRTKASRAWKTAKQDGNGLHEARHTFASLMIAAGVDAKALSTYMGHSSITIALSRHGQLLSGNEGEAAGLLDADPARCAPVSRQKRPDSAGFDRTWPDPIPHG